MGKLSDVAIRNWIKAGERFEGKGDGDGLYLRYRKSDGGPRWVFRYQFAGRPRVLHLGSYSTLSLADARKVAKEMRARVALGFDVAAEKQERKRDAVEQIEAGRRALTVAQLADLYLAERIIGRWKHPNIVRSRIERDVKPNLGKLALSDVRPTPGVRLRRETGSRCVANVMGVSTRSPMAAPTYLFLLARRTTKTNGHSSSVCCLTMPADGASIRTSSTFSTIKC
jgi:hypothetical protein